MKQVNHEEEIKKLRKEMVQIQNLIEKQEANDVFDESLYEKLDSIEEQIAYHESQLNIA